MSENRGNKTHVLLADEPPYAMQWNAFNLGLLPSKHNNNNYNNNNDNNLLFIRRKIAFKYMI